jgi:signal transduction histidine kinase
LKFSFKVFAVTILTVVVSFCIGGYLLISSLFHSALNREISAAVAENKMLRFTYESALTAIVGAGDIADDTVAALSRTVLGGDTKVRISDANFATVYENEDVGFAKDTIDNLQSHQRRYLVRQSGDEYLIQTACMFSAGGRNYYLETFKDITALFADRQHQFEMYQRIILVLIAINGALVYLVSRWLTRPIKKLSEAARAMADGRYGDRVAVYTADEIGMLASDFNRMADEVEHRIGELEEAARRQEDFVASFAHELKTPLTSMIGYSDMLRLRKLPEEEQFLAANYIFSEGKRLEALSLKLLELIVLQKSRLETKKVGTKQWLKDIRVFMASSIGKDVRFKWSVEEAVIQIEPDLFKTVMLNLLDNAIKALEGEGTVRLIGKKESGGYSFYVEDTGKGIAPEDLPRITEAFYMADKSRSRSAGGAGLGLSIAREIVRLHGGDITFESQMGKGTRVHVFLKEGELWAGE